MLDLHNLTPRQQQILDELPHVPDTGAGDALLATLADLQAREGERMNAWRRRFMAGEIGPLDEGYAPHVDPRVEVCREAGVDPYGAL